MLVKLGILLDIADKQEGFFDTKLIAEVAAELAIIQFPTRIEFASIAGDAFASAEIEVLAIDEGVNCRACGVFQTVRL